MMFSDDEKKDLLDLANKMKFITSCSSSIKRNNSHFCICNNKKEW